VAIIHRSPGRCAERCVRIIEALSISTRFLDSSTIPGRTDTPQCPPCPDARRNGKTHTHRARWRPEEPRPYSTAPPGETRPVPPAEKRGRRRRTLWPRAGCLAVTVREHNAGRLNSAAQMERVLKPPPSPAGINHLRNRTRLRTGERGLPWARRWPKLALPPRPKLVMHQQDPAWCEA